MLSSKAMEGFRRFIETNVQYAKVKINNNYVKLLIHRKERLNDGQVAIYISITPQSSNDVTIREVQLCDNNNDVFASKVENILIKSVQEGVLYRFTFDFKEV